MSWDSKIESLLAVLGALVPLCSALASWVNHHVRTKQTNGEAVSPLLLHAGSVLNVASVNLDKAVQLGKLARKPKGEAPAPNPQPALPVCETCPYKAGA